MMATRDTPSVSPDIQRLLDQGYPLQQAVAMLQQNANAAKLPPSAHGQNPSLAHSIAPNYPAGNTQDPTTFFSGLDASSSKQLAALTAAGNARRLTQSGGTSGNFVGGMTSSQNPFGPSSSLGHPPPAQMQHVPNGAMGMPVSAPFNMPSQGDPSVAQRSAMISPQQMNAQAYKTRQQSFLNGLAKIMIAGNTPLPPSVTGLQYPYDPETSPWKALEPASEVGGFKLAGKDVDLFKLWGLVYHEGGAAKVHQQNGWTNIAAKLGLPERLPLPQLDGNLSTAIALAQHYKLIILPFEEVYVRSANGAQRQAGMQQGRAGQPFTGQMNGMPTAGIPNPQFPVQGAMGINPLAPQTVSQTPQRPNASMINLMQQNQNAHNIPPGPGGSVHVSQPVIGPDFSGSNFIASGSNLDLDSEGRKRKLNEFDDLNGKRSRRKTESELATSASRAGTEPMSHTPAPLAAPINATKLRRKIEYYPLTREVETAGGRDVNQIQTDLLRLSRGRPLRDINEWGKVHIDALTMSLRSRISTELSYSLTTLIILSTMRGAAPDTGFPISQCEDLLEELLDLLEELAFNGQNEIDPPLGIDDNTDVVTNRQLVNAAHEEISSPFASSERTTGEYDSTQAGPVQRKGDLIRIILNILRNLSAVTENQPFMARHAILTDVLLRLTCLRTSNNGIPQAASPVLSIPDMIVVRKDILNTFVNLAGAVDITTMSSPNIVRRCQRIFNLVSSYLVDPADALPPFTWMLQTGSTGSLHVRAPLLPDAALEIFTRVSQLDANRQVFSNNVPKQWIWCLFEALVHRLPTSEHDFTLVMREESWLSYLEKLIMGLYSLAFLMSPDLKKRAKTDRSIGFSRVMLRLLKRIWSTPQAEQRSHFYICARRAIETMKVIDDGNDSFDSSQPSLPLLSFGVGYGEVGDKRVEKGNGLWSGHRDDVLWGIMFQREVDDVMFSELESLARVECDIPLPTF